MTSPLSAPTDRACRVIAIANQKGGVAKTTTVASLGSALAELGRRTLVVDLDAQACLSFSLGLDPDTLELSIFDVLLGRVSPSMAVQHIGPDLDLLPATIDLAGAEQQLQVRTAREYILKTLVNQVASSYDVVLLDCAPSLGILTVNALTAADEVIVPMQCEALSHRGVGQLLDTVHDVQVMTNPSLRIIGVLPTMYDGRTTHAREVLADIAGRYGLPVLPPIAKSVRFAEAPTRGRSILATAGRSAGAAAYRQLARHLLGLEDATIDLTPAEAEDPVPAGPSE